MRQRLCERIDFGAFRRRNPRPWHEIRRREDDPQWRDCQPHASFRQNADQIIDAARSFINSLCAKDRYCHPFEAALWNGFRQMPQAPAGVVRMSEASQHQQVTPYGIAGGYRSYRRTDNM